jgi:hypothetical protein
LSGLEGAPEKLAQQCLSARVGDHAQHGGGAAPPADLREAKARLAAMTKAFRKTGSEF